MIRFGLIGAGRIGKVHAATIAANPKAKLAYVADAFQASAEALAAQTGAEVANAEDVINSPNVDAILIATPTASHADLIEAAAKAGKAILCEKPVSLSVERINACLDVVERNRSTLMIGFNRRFDPNFASVEARLRRGDIGEIEMVTITSRDPAPPPAGVCQILRRPVPRHDDPRFRYGPLSHGRGIRRRKRTWIVARR